MKKTIKTIFALFPLACILSCSNSLDIENYGTSNTNRIINKTRTLEEAIQIAQSYLSIFDDNPNTRAAYESNEKKVDMNNIQVICNSLSTRSVKGSSNDTLIYILNFENKEGFAIISANEGTEGLLAITDSGSISSIDEIEIPGLKLFLNASVNYVSKSAYLNATNIKRINRGLVHVHDTIASLYIRPKITTKWESSSTEGKFCPNGKAGCFAITIFQAMNYFEYPNYINFTYTGRVMDSANLPHVAWMNISNHKSIGSDSCSEDRHDIISCIYREIGERCQCEYHMPTNTRSSVITDDDIYTQTTFSKMKEGMNNFGFITSNINAYSSTSIRNNLTQSNLIIMAGVSDYHDANHTWIADGCRYYSVNHKMYIVEGETRTLIDSVFETLSLSHYNWGWGGVADGYYNDNVFNPSNCNILDNEYDPYYGMENFSNVKYFTVEH